MAKAVAELDPETEAVWADWFSTKKTSIAEAMSVFRIITDADPDVSEADDFVPDVPFIMRARQADALEMIEKKFWAKEKRSARLIILKARRYGATTFFLLLCLERVLRVPGYSVLLVAQDDAMARWHFQRLRDSFSQVPKDVLAAHGITVFKETDNQLVLRHGESKTSSFTVAPAKRGALGRGAQYNALLLTEHPNWPKSAKQDLSGVLRSCRNVKGNLIVFESTAKGYDDFFRRYKNAVKRRSDYRAMFIASWEHPGNRKKFESAEAETEFITTIGRQTEYGAEDETVLFRRLTVDLRWSFSDAAQFLHWRRSTLIDDCEGSLDNLHREEPNTPDEAFAGTGVPLFKKEIVEAWRPYAEAREDAAERGMLLLRKDFVFAPDIRADLTLFERPIPKRLYAFGSDVASGVAMHADGKTEADFSYTTVKDARTKFTVARLRVHMPPTEFAQLTFHLACWYGGARGFIERAINDSGVCINAFEDFEHKEWAGSQLLLSQKTLIKTDDASVRANYKWTPGWKTTHKSKPKLIDNIRKEILDFGMPDGTKPCPYDLQFIAEAMRFERDDRTGQMGAATGHDDGVIAEGLCLEACDRVLAEAVEDGVVAYKPPTTGDEILMDFCRTQAAHREEEGLANPIADMDGY